MEEKATVLLSTKSWHYRFMKLVLGKVAPTPENMHNLCPYFWLLVFSLLVCIVVLPIKGIIKVLLWFEVGYNTLLDKICFDALFI